jgi:hypothetical protein
VNRRLCRRHGDETVRLARLTAVLLASGLALLVVAILLSTLPANAATERDGGSGDYGYQYTDHPSRVSTGRTVALYVDRDFNGTERQRIVSAMRQWNYALNGSVRFTASLLPEDVSASEIAQIRRSGGWIVAKVDSSHPITRQGEGRQALAVTVGGRGGGFVYVIGDRIGRRDLTGVVMHEFGHVLGAGHDGYGLMAPVYNANSGHCIDRDAAMLVANAQHLQLSQMNWCEPMGDYRSPMASRR